MCTMVLKESLVWMVGPHFAIGCY